MGLDHFCKYLAVIMEDIVLDWYNGNYEAKTKMASIFQGDS